MSKMGFRIDGLCIYSMYNKQVTVQMHQTELLNCMK